MCRVCVGESVAALTDINRHLNRAAGSNRRPTLIAMARASEFVGDRSHDRAPSIGRMVFNSDAADHWCLAGNPCWHGVPDECDLRTLRQPTAVDSVCDPAGTRECNFDGWLPFACGGTSRGSVNACRLFAGSSCVAESPRSDGAGTALRREAGDDDGNGGRIEQGLTGLSTLPADRSKPGAGCGWKAFTSHTTPVRGGDADEAPAVKCNQPAVRRTMHPHQSDRQ